MSEPERICNLLDIDVEPTDEQLARLMHLVGEDVRARKAAAEQRLWETVARETAEARCRMAAMEEGTYEPRSHTVTNHPYIAFENTPLWRQLDDALRALEKNDDIELCTSRAHIIGYLCKSLTENGAV